MSLINASRNNDAVTINGMVTNSTTLSSCLDLFFSVGAMRNGDKERLINMFVKAYDEDPLLAIKILFWSRDIRGGSGERQVFRDIWKHLVTYHTEIAIKLAKYIPIFGRWDDLWLDSFNINQNYDNVVFNLIKENVTEPLLAKWLPRKKLIINGKNFKVKLEQFLHLSPKNYRKLIVSTTKVVEQQMCANQWNEIKYEHVPSLAISRYSKAFDKHDHERFNKYKTNDNIKVNVGAVYPYDVIKNLKHGDIDMSKKQWDSLPNYLEDNQERILPVCDTSGSMYHGIIPNLSPLDICMSLGLYISERNIGPFKDAFITFSESPKLQYLKGNLFERYCQLTKSEWGMNTNLEAVFNLILEKARKYNLPESEMPTMILILSDMEFDVATNNKHTAFDMIKYKYESFGYELPNIVFWNLNSKSNNYPVQIESENVALISGFSPNILKSLLSGEVITPLNIMFKTINSERYKIIEL